MKRWIFGIIPVLVVMSASQSVAANSITAAGQIITITAKVDSKLSVVIDGTGRINQIFSNSDQASAPTFMSGSLTGPAITPNQLQLDEYQSLMRNRTVIYGILYERTGGLPDVLTTLLNRPAVPTELWTSR